MGNFEEAFKLFTTAAEEGLAEAQHNLGLMYASGKGVPQDTNKAAEWYRLAAEQGLAVSQHELGFMYFEDMNLVVDLEILIISLIHGTS